MPRCAPCWPTGWARPDRRFAGRCAGRRGNCRRRAAGDARRRSADAQQRHLLCAGSGRARPARTPARNRGAGRRHRPGRGASRGCASSWPCSTNSSKTSRKKWAKFGSTSPTASSACMRADGRAEADAGHRALPGTKERHRRAAGRTGRGRGGRARARNGGRRAHRGNPRWLGPHPRAGGGRPVAAR
jgi:hypothetical protein